MKRKILAMICAAVMAVGLAACAMPANESQSSQQQFAEAEKQKKPAPKPEESIKDLLSRYIVSPRRTKRPGE